jgi:hypothetical protein
MSYLVLSMVLIEISRHSTWLLLALDLDHFPGRQSSKFQDALHPSDLQYYVEYPPLALSLERDSP